MLRSITRYTTALALALAPFWLHGQAYSFVRIPPGANPYSQLTGAIPVDVYFGVNSTVTIDDINGQNFWVFGGEYAPPTNGNVLLMGENAFIEFINDSSLIVMDAAFTTMEPNGAGDWRYFKLEGPPGSHILKFEWRDARLVNGPAVNAVNVQIWFYQATGVVEYRYGPRSANNVSGYTTSSGPNVGLFWAPNNFSTSYGKVWLNGAPNSPTTDVTQTNYFAALQGIPDEGTVYRFTPTFTLPIGVEEHGSMNMLNVYPDPAIDLIRVPVDASMGSVSIDVIDQAGRRIRASERLGPDGTMSIKGFEAGAYLLRLNTSNGTYWARFVKQ